METIIIHIKNKKEILTAFLSSLKISFRTEPDEDNLLTQLYDKAKSKKEKPIPFDFEGLKK